MIPKLYQCDRCEAFADVFKFSQLSDGSDECRYFICELCTEVFHRELDQGRGELIKKFMAIDDEGRKDLLHLAVEKVYKGYTGPLTTTPIFP